MKAKLIHFLSFILLLNSLVPAVSLTLEEIAGTFEGWRTETSSTGTIRYREVDEILPDGTFHSWLLDEETGTVISQTTVISLDADGKISGPWAGYLKINGNQLQIKARGDEFAMHAVTHRTD